MIVIYIVGGFVSLSLIIFLYVSFAPQFGSGIYSRKKAIEKSPNFRDGRFRNIEETPMYGDNTSFVKITKDFIKGGENRTPKEIIQSDKFDKDQFLATDSGLHYVWFGHSTILINLEGKIILIDPVFSERPSPFPFGGMKSFKYSHFYGIESLPEIDFILISHDHYDHLDYQTIKKLNSKVKQFYVPVGVASHLLKWGVDNERIIEMDWWDKYQMDDIIFTATPARHFTGRRGWDKDKTLWCSWAIEGANHAVYYSGDSGYGRHFSEIYDKMGSFDLVILECGQYNESWPYIHMFPEETIQAFIDLNGKELLPVHWGKFNLSLHDWREPIDRASRAAIKKNICLEEKRIGRIYSF